jgi:hypothetical protein
MNWRDEELTAVEIGVVGGFARGCHAGGITQFALLSAAGSTPRSRIRHARVMGSKEETVQTTFLTRRTAGSRNSRPDSPSRQALLARNANLLTVRA